MMAGRAEHYRRAEQLLEGLESLYLNDPRSFSVEWAQVNAQVALAHATLATAPWEMGEGERE